MCYHIPLFLASTGIKCFTGQGVEKTNDVIRRLYHLKSNKHDACKDGLQAVKRLHELENFDRQPRKYKLSDKAYWESGINEERQKRPRLSVTPLEDELNLNQLNRDELKAKLRQMNVKTRVRNVERLRQLLKDHIYAKQ